MIYIFVNCLTYNFSIMATISYPTLNLIDNYFGVLPINSFSNDTAIIGKLYQNLNSQFSKKDIGNIPYLKFIQNPDIIGVDLPVLIENKVKNPKEIVVILGQDPLRDKTDSQVNSINPTLPNDVIVGTPYAVHFPNTYKGVKLYHDIFDYILGKYPVYLTDILKFHSNRNSKNDFNTYYKGSIKINALNLLKEELKCLQDLGYVIKYAILFGGKTQALSTLFPPTCTIINFPHPSGTANRKWAKLVEQCTDNYKVNYIIDKLNGI